MSLPGFLVYLAGVPITACVLDYGSTRYLSRNDGTRLKQEDIIHWAVLWPVSIPFIGLSTLACLPFYVREYKKNKP